MPLQLSEMDPAKKERLARLALLLTLTISGLILFRGYFFRDKLMVFNDIGEDTWQLYTAYYASIANHIRDGSFSFWDFTNGYGTSLLTFNFLDPTVALTILLGVIFGTRQMLSFLIWVYLLRIVLSGWIFYKYLSLFSFSIQAKLAASLAYAFNAHLIVWGQHYHFGIVCIYFPMLLICLEHFLRKEKGRFLLAPAVALCSIYSAYMTYMMLLALGIYMIFRLGMEEGTFKEKALTLFRGGLFMLLGLGLGAFFFFPLAYAIVGITGRMESGATLLDWAGFYPLRFFISALMRAFSSNLQLVESLADGKYELIYNYYEDPVLFCGSLTVLLNLQLPLALVRSDLTKRKKGWLLAGILFILLFFSCMLGGTVMNGFTSPAQRYNFTLFPFLLLGLAFCWDYLRKGGRFSWILLALSAILMNAVYLIGAQQSMFAEYIRNAKVLQLIGNGMLIVLALIMLLGERARFQRLKGGLWLVLLGLLLLDVGADSRTAFLDRIQLHKEDTPIEEMEQAEAAYKAGISDPDGRAASRAALNPPQDYFRELFNEDVQAALDYIRRIDPVFTRTEKDYMAATYAMDGQFQSYYGIGTYNSMMNKDLIRFTDLLYPSYRFRDINHYAFWDQAKDNWFAAFSGIRYLLSKKEKLYPARYEEIARFGEIIVYKNRMRADIGKVMTEMITEEDLEQSVRPDNVKALLSGAVSLDTKEMSGETKAQLSFSEASAILEAAPKKPGFGSASEEAVDWVTIDPIENEDHLSGRVHASEDGCVLLMIPYEGGWSLTVDKEEAELLNADVGFCAFLVKAGDHSFEMHFFPPWMKEGILVSALSLCIYLALLLLNKRRGKKRSGGFMT